MTVYVTSLAAAIGCSLCNGVSTVQQKIGVDREGKVRTFNLMLLIKLFRSPAYTSGVALEFVGYGLSLVALRVLPLFVVQSLIAASVVVTAFGERFFLKRHLSKRTYVSLLAVIMGLVLLCFGSVASRANVTHDNIRGFIELMPLPIAIIGAIFVRMRGRLSASVLAALGGLAFGNTSTIGRILIYPHPLWHLITNPLIYSLIISGILGQYFFTIALQRSSATKSNAVMISMQTLAPAALGLLFLGDRIRDDFQVVVLIGAILVLLGSAMTVVAESPAATI